MVKQNVCSVSTNFIWYIVNVLFCKRNIKVKYLLQIKSYYNIGLPLFDLDQHQI